MMGKTNAIYVENAEKNELALHIENILMDTIDDIWKIEYVNEMFFVFLEDGRILYGKDVSDLQVIMQGGSTLVAHYVIYKDNTYLFMANGLRCTYTQDMINFNVVEIKAMTGYFGAGLILDRNGRIIIIGINVSDSKVGRIGIFNSVGELDEEEHPVIAVSFAKSINQSSATTKLTKIYQNRLVIVEDIYTDGVSFVVVTLDGKCHAVSSKDPFVMRDGIYSSSLATGYNLYYSYDAVNYHLLGKINVKIHHMAIYGGGTIGIFDKNGRFSLAGSRKDMIESLGSMIEIEEATNIIKCSCNVGMYTYLGCKGGIILKTYADFSGNGTSPDISLLKTLSARQALNDAKEYTDIKYAELETRIGLLEVQTGLKAE